MQQLSLSLFLWPILMFLPATDTSHFSPADGLVAYYSFNHCDARDDSGNGSDGVLFGEVGCWCGIEDDGLMLDGRRDYVEFRGLVNKYFNTSDFTISFYFKPQGYSVFPQSLLGKRSRCDERHMLDMLLNMPLKAVDTYFHQTASIYYRDISPEYEAPGWHHFALVRDGRIARTYINGQLQRRAIRCRGVDISNETPLSLANSPCVVRGKARRFKGIIDELRVYDRALTDEEMAELYAMYPVESAEQDCVSFAPKKMPDDLYIPTQSPYLCRID